MEIDQFTSVFFQMEMEESLFAIRMPNGDPFWDIVRYEIFFSLSDQKDAPCPPLNPSTRQLFQGWRDKFQRTPSKIMTMAEHWARLKSLPPTDFVAYVCSRYKDANNNPIDFSTHDASEILKQMGSVRKIESQQDLSLDLNIGPLFGVASKLYRQPARTKRFLCDVAKLIAGAQRKHFGVDDPRLLEVIRVVYRYYSIQRYLWREILDRGQPRLVLMIQNGIQKGVIAEARERQIPVVECQHGVINLMHPAYAYPPTPPSEDCIYLPDALLLFSNYWKHQCRLPGTKLAAVGNSSFSNIGPHSTRTGGAVFVDAEIFHKHLSPVAVEVAKLMPERSFIVKLHPMDLAHRAEIEREYQRLLNISVVGAEKTFPELLVDTSDVIAIQSTATYEALDRGVPVHFLRKGDYRSHQDLFNRPDVHLFSSAEELKVALFKPSTGSKFVSRFFDDFNPRAFRELVKSLC